MKMSLGSKIKKAYNDYITKLSKINQEEFGSKGLDCCELNKKKK